VIWSLLKTKMAPHAASCALPNVKLSWLCVPPSYLRQLPLHQYKRTNTKHSPFLYTPKSHTRLVTRHMPKIKHQTPRDKCHTSNAIRHTSQVTRYTRHKSHTAAITAGRCAGQVRGVVSRPHALPSIAQASAPDAREPSKKSRARIADATNSIVQPRRAQHARCSSGSLFT